MLDPKVFKAYDVRGIYPAELDEEGAYAIGRAYVEQFSPTTIAVGRDMRVSGAVDGGGGASRAPPTRGADVLDLGMVGTEMLYFAVGELGLDGGIAVTASHNPKQYTGMKIVRARRAAGRRRVRAARRPRPRARRRLAPTRAPRHVRDEDIWARFVDRVLSFVDVVGAATAAGRDRRRATAWPARCCRRCSSGCRCSTSCAATSSPTGRSRTTSRTRCCPRTASSSSGKTLEEAPTSASPTTATPTAASSSTTRGEFVPGDFTTALFAESILAKEPGGKVIYDVRASWAVPEAIRAAGGEPLVNRVGHAFIKQRMRDERRASSAARSRRTTTSATSRRPTRGRSRSC